MATKLKNLKVKKVDFVDEGANPDAHIELFKRKDGKPEEDPKKPKEDDEEEEKPKIKSGSGSPVAHELVRNCFALLFPFFIS